MKRYSGYLIALLLLTACGSNPKSPEPLQPGDQLPLPAHLGEVVDERERYFELYCSINQQIGEQMPDYRTCEDALVPPLATQLVSMDAVDRSAPASDIDIIMVPGLGWDCIAEYVGTPQGVVHLRSLGYNVVVPHIEGLSSSERNAQLIYGYLVNNQLLDNGRKKVFFGYSKGTPDILETLVTFPHVAEQTAAVVSIAGAAWGTPVADTTSDKMLDAYNWVPGKDCVTVDHKGLESLKPAVRKQWFEEHALPEGIRYYSLVTVPDPDQVSKALRSGYKQLGEINPYNDTQLIYYDQILPDSTLLGYLKGDHLAIAVPIAREHKFVGAVALDKNAYPREIMLEATIRYLEADMAGSNE